MTEYNVVLKDADGCEITGDIVSGMAAARQRARYLLTDTYASYIGTTHAALGTVKTEVQDNSGTCLWDAFRAGDR